MPELFKGCKSSTVTVGELIARLSAYDPEMPIAYTWEGQVLPVNLDEITVQQETEFVHGPVVLLDADNY